MLNSWIDRIFALLFLALVALSLYAYQELQRRGGSLGLGWGGTPASAAPTRGFPEGFERDPGYVEARLGFSSLGDGDIDAAVAHLEGAIARAPENPAWRFMLSDALRARGEERQARLEARKAQDLLRSLEPARAATIPN